MRLSAALLVLASHSFDLTGQREPLGKLTGFLTGGGLAVDVFFFISGYVVTQSAFRRDLFTFCAARALRILPGLALVTVLTVVFGAAVTSLSQGQYWSSSMTWDYLWNALLFPIRFELPGVFETLPLTSVNGSLWTLPFEVSMYLCSALLIVARLRDGRAYCALAVVLFISYFVAVRQLGLNWQNRGPELLPGVQLFNFLSFGCLYFAGAAMATCSWLRPNMPVGLIALGLLAGVPLLGRFAEPVFLVALPLAIHWLAFAAPTGRFLAADISYGTYLYAFPVQQAIINGMGPQIGPVALTLAAIPPSLLLGLMSWKAIEKPALNLKRQLEIARAGQPHLDAR